MIKVCNDIFIQTMQDHRVKILDEARLSYLYKYRHLSNSCYSERRVMLLWFSSLDHPQVFLRPFVCSMLI